MQSFRLWLEYTAMPPGFKKIDDIHWACPPMPIPEDIKRMYVVFKRAGFQLLIAGGAVRDHIRGEKPKDLDLATNATPNQVKEILKNNGFRSTEEVGESFGIVIYISPEKDDKGQNKRYEIATFRIDKEAGRQTEVEFIRNPEQDALRRDLTMNAMFYDMGSGQVIDYVGGLEDTLEGKALPVGDPLQRFGEDPLRVMRTIRFHARFNKNPQLENDVKNAIRIFVNNGMRDKKGRPLAPERVRDEFAKGLKSAKIPVVYLQLCEQLGLLRKYVLPGFQKYNTNFINSRDVYAVIASVLKYNTLDEAFESNLRTVFPETAKADRILYYLNMLNVKRKKLKPDVVSGLIDKNKPKISDEDLAQYAHWFNLPFDVVKKLASFQPKKTGEVPGAMDLLQMLQDRGREEAAARSQMSKQERMKEKQERLAKKGTTLDPNQYAKGYNTWKALQDIGRMPRFGEWFRAMEQIENCTSA